MEHIYLLIGIIFFGYYIYYLIDQALNPTDYVSGFQVGGVVRFMGVSLLIVIIINLFI